MKRRFFVLSVLLLVNACVDNNIAKDGDADERLLPSECSGQCNAATPMNPVLSSNGGWGNVTSYSTAASNGGACNYGSTHVMYYAAMSVNVAPGDGKGQWAKGRICGQCAEVTALTSKGPKTVVVRIMDKCPDGNCGIDLGGAATTKIMLDGIGRYEGKWRYVSCQGYPQVYDGPPSLHVFNGSNPWWSRIQVYNPPTAVSSITWQDIEGTTQGLFTYASDPENTFEAPTDLLQSKIESLLITVNYIDGSKNTIQLAPSQLSASNNSYPLE